MIEVKTPTPTEALAAKLRDSATLDVRELNTETLEALMDAVRLSYYQLRREFNVRLYGTP